ncbi:acyl-CoA thioesterase [Moraxella cuniculi]|uniref:Acyl-ACP thioesterase n=1 Tax=Moraxella cuniculi TaxID=34061 RepID=A0A3S4SYF9_9GAMM|nr:thioesterase family protein [Moraxella cuniculi]VEG12626.1 Acyl-ACP thioesterase [Moraxella cuniculi]
MLKINTIFEPILTGDARPAALQDYPVVCVQPVAWGDMDGFNHVNNVVYYRYAESARIAYMRAIGFLQAREDLLTILAHASMQYHRPVVYPDTLLIGVRIKHLGTTSIVQEYAMFSQAQQAVVATGEAVIVRTDRTMSKIAWSGDERAKVAAFEGREF